MLNIAQHPVAGAQCAVFPEALDDTGTDLPCTEQDLLALRQLMRGGSKSFFAASLLLPARVRNGATALYAFCRLADDAVDLGADPHAAVRDLHQRLDGIYAGRPQRITADRALAVVVHRHGIPRLLLDALLEGFVWDADGRRHETLADVQAYGARVAGTVGAMMALIMGVRSEAALARACELGVAMQLTNIARDVGEDARNGRLYLPRQWLAEAGVNVDAWLRQPVFTPAIACVVQRLLQAADTLYQQAEHGVAELPRDCRPAIRAARLVYAEIGTQLLRGGADSVNRRVVVSRQRKLALMARATGAAVMSSGQPGCRLPVLPAVRYLVDAARAPALTLAPAQPSKPRPATAAAPGRPLDQRVAWLMDLFERQEGRRQQRLQAGRRSGLQASAAQAQGGD
jgi:phytoene synthase